MKEAQIHCTAEDQEELFKERPDEHRIRRISHYVVYFTITSSSLFYSVVLISLWPYLNRLDSSVDKSFIGYLAGIGSIGVTFLCPVFGKWSNSSKSCRVPFLFTLACGLVHYIFYVSLPLLPVESRRYWFLFARCLGGLNDINIGLSRGYIAESTLKSERRRAVSILTGLQTIAFACGPALQSLMVPLAEEGYSFLNGYVRVDMYTSIGWLGLFSTLINMVLFLPAIFQHSDVRHAEQSHSTSNNLNRYYKLIAWIFIMLQFWLICAYLFLKVLGTPIVMDEYAMNRPDALQFNSNIVTGGAIVSLVAILIMDFCCKKLGEMNVMYVGFLIMVIGRYVMYPIGEDRIVTAMNDTDLGCPQWSQEWCAEERQMYKSQFILSNVLENFGYSWTITIIYTKFSQILGAKQQGTWMGFMTSFSGLARILSPIVLSYLYASSGNAHTVLITNFIYIALIIITLWLINHWTEKGSATASIHEADVDVIEEVHNGLIDQRSKEMQPLDTNSNQ